VEHLFGERSASNRVSSQDRPVLRIEVDHMGLRARRIAPTPASAAARAPVRIVRRPASPRPPRSPPRRDPPQGRLRTKGEGVEAAGGLVLVNDPLPPRSVRRSTRISTTAITSTMASGACVTGSARSFDMNGMAMKGTSAAM
jgi:hypothetical protein